MSILLQKRADKSLSLIIDGDLQFDSRDERIYHETFVLPAMALALKRTDALKVLIAGGGDGLCAREVLKESRVASLTLVDYDASVINLARGELAELNCGSLSDERVTVEVMDAFDYAAYQKMDGHKFDLIICDFTVPRNLAGAKLLGVEWFGLVRELLTEAGVACINGVSPCLYSDAYWSIYNSLRTVGLATLPFRVPLQSFRAAGYGPDWGFFLASPSAFSADELSRPLSFAQPAEQLRSDEQWCKLFQFPRAMVGRRAFSKPTAGCSDLLITYLSNPNGEGSLAGGGALSVTDCDFDFLALGTDPAPLPDADCGDRVLPEQLSSHLHTIFGGDSDQVYLNEAGEPVAPSLEDIVARVGEYMPALDVGHSRSMVEQFLEDPMRFMRAIDLSDLVDRLLKRAAELPRLLVDELIALKQKLVDFVCDRDNILALGSKALAVIALVVILGNLVFTDNAYGKGGHGSFGHVSDSPGSLSRPGHSRFDSDFAPAEYATGPGFRPGNYGYGRSVDETGFVFPARRYRYYGNSYSRNYYYRHRTPHTQPPKEIYASYRLTPEADVLPDGTVVVNLTDDAFLQLGNGCNTVVDAWTGVPICDLARDPAQTFRVCKEVERQTAGLRQSIAGKVSWNKWMDWLDFVPWYGDDQAELNNLVEMETRLEAARKSLGEAPPLVPPLQQPPVEGSIEVFASVWLKRDGLSLIVQRPEGLAYFDDKGWYEDLDRKHAIAGDYPRDLGRVVVSFYRKQLREKVEIRKRLIQEKIDAQADHYALTKDLAEYKACYADTSGYELVDYGSTQIRLDDAVARTNKDLDMAQQRVTLIDEQLGRMPEEWRLAQIFVDKYGPLYDKKPAAPTAALPATPGAKTAAPAPAKTEGQPQ
ncbi:MAG: hypothetical protein JSS86_08810 [Cyanobacteria bacterium SZAS LIN-2]|nr:hypothetical protein [Cyanobacteria bacterium SZAS LIN-2]